MFSKGRGPTVPRHLRNPHRACDEEGREITPATIANVQEAGARGIIARCVYEHEALLSLEELHPIAKAGQLGNRPNARGATP